MYQVYENCSLLERTDFFFSSYSSISGMISTRRDALRTENDLSSVLMLELQYVPRGSSRNRRSWAAFLCQAPDRSDALFITKRAPYKAQLLIPLLPIDESEKWEVYQAADSAFFLRFSSTMSSTAV